MGEDIISGLECLAKAKNYAVIGENATLIYTRQPDHIKAPIYILTTNPMHHKIINNIESPLETLSKTAIINKAQKKQFKFKGISYTIHVAKIEHLIALELASGKHLGRDAFILIQQLTVNLEEVRTLLKNQKNYEKIYTTITRAYYELAHN